MPQHVRKGDIVFVRTGKQRGQQGSVLRVIPKRSMVVVQGINVRTKTTKPTQANPQGGKITKEMPVHISNVSPLVEGKPTRVRYRVKPDGTKVRLAVKGGAQIGQELRTAKA